MSAYSIKRNTAEPEQRKYHVTVWDSTISKTVDGFSGEGTLNPHSVWKFFQAYATVSGGAGKDLSSEEIAIMCSSNSGEDVHADIVEGILDRVGLSESDLQSGARNFFRSKRGEDIPNQCYCDCGGKHAGFLKLARQLAGDDDEFAAMVAGYLEGDGAVQQEVVQALIRDGLVTQDEVNEWTWEKDGCGAPVPVMKEATLAHLYAVLASGENEHLKKMFDAAAAHPELIGGTDNRLVTEIARGGIRENGDTVTKDGFGSVLATSIVDGNRSLGIIIHDEVQDNFRDDELAVILTQTLESLGLPLSTVQETVREMYGSAIFDEVEIQQVSENKREPKEIGRRLR